MRIIISILFLLGGVGVNAQSFISQPYFFYGNEEAIAYYQSYDTLKIYSGFLPLAIPDKNISARHQYKILSTESLDDDFIALKMKDINKVNDAKHNKKSNSYTVIIFEKTKNQIKPLIERGGLTKSELENYDLNELNYKEAFGFPFYSLKYMKELYELKHIKTKADYDKIVNTLMKNMENYKDISEDYQNNFYFTDMYGSKFTGFLLTKTCLDLSYNPFYAGLIGQVFEDGNIPEEKIKERLKFVYEDLGLD